MDVTATTVACQFRDADVEKNEALPRYSIRLVQKVRFLELPLAISSRVAMVERSDEKRGTLISGKDLEWTVLTARAIPMS